MNINLTHLFWEKTTQNYTSKRFNMKATEKAILRDVRAKYKKVILMARLSFSHKLAIRYLRRRDMGQGVCFYLQCNTDIEKPHAIMYRLMTDAGIDEYYYERMYPLEAKSRKELIASLKRRLWILDEILKLEVNEN